MAEPVWPDPVIGAVLCGGRSSRFGSDKALASFQGALVGERVVRALRSAGLDPVVAIGGRTGDRLGLPTIPDRRPGDGPLGGLATALLWARTGWVLVVPCDLPLLSAEHVTTLLADPGNLDGPIVATVGGQPRVSLSIWPASEGRRLLRLLDGGERRFRAALDECRWHGVEIPEAAVTDADTPDELAELERALGDASASVNACFRSSAGMAVSPYRITNWRVIVEPLGRLVPLIPPHLHVYQLVTNDQDLDSVVAAALTSDRYAIDTEFHRERTYYPQVALIQLGWDDEVALIDPLEVDPKPLAELLDSDATCIVHAGVQDLEVLDLSCGTIPKHLFDTQIAAGFLGVSTGSLASLLDRFLGIKLPKGDRLTDWLRRPLTEDQLQYGGLGRRSSARPHRHTPGQARRRGTDPLGHRGVRTAQGSASQSSGPRGRDRANQGGQVAQGAGPSGGNVDRGLARTPGGRAHVPVRQVMSDLGIVAIAQLAPTSTEQLRGLRGVEGRHLRDGADRQILDAVKAGKERKSPARQAPRAPELPRHLRPVVTLVTTWIAQLARDHRLDPALLATRADVESLLKNEEHCRLNLGWRQELVGKPIAQLVGGDAAVAFDGDGNLVLEARSRQSLL